ncbi:FtsW/RodA/SpoVE family cell cycle protein [Pseudoflavonifractor phocaeensis]|uniref:FtsW/RodA/SpoVE family cell cycle protein n=1 Tax=Pseudoflavonifractor phocaeensis TaxID=1870988 RepID=UPI001956CD8B|nr:FtsW/RodA/SpoVE family cell cycle protein [Pseudoflavonifractor phocaeensis]MBM6925162.1 FtsW/RodA/SpoVE family cell cycle protein [Pseudoflavonifractor phocaeensis]
MSWIKDSMRAFFEQGDRLLLTLCLMASGFGLVLIFSATRYLGAGDAARCMIVQTVAILMGVVIYMLMSSVDIELFVDKFWKWLLVFNLVINALVRTPLGVEVNGNRSWLHIPGFPVNLQPAELAKLTFVLLLALQISRLQERGISRPTSVFQIAGHTLFMFGVVAVTSGDFGMGLTYLLIFVIMAWAGGVKKRWFLLAIVVCAVGLVLIWPHVKDMYYMKRFTVVIDHLTGNQDTITEQTLGRGWQQTRSILAIGSGGLTGMGYLQGIQTQSTSESSLPARETDEIFAVCGEEFGLVGCVLLLAILTAIILRCIWVSRRACSPQSAFIAMGYAGMLIAQVGVNVGMCLYIFPVVGLTLPFVSYGGSSIITMYAAMGLVSSIKMRSLPSWLRDRSQL